MLMLRLLQRVGARQFHLLQLLMLLLALLHVGLWSLVCILRTARGRR
jgi:hypothetical protein